ncbi:malate dehydrogenase [Strigomonas culicis]|uniref:Malate dehydrogenase n=1 Tax=Strigomonas culicis TaxID=28005 RepID=S9VZV8_9TRYP|nr:malate dehydrogenase [Strigomonas culicis]|eukprot:EPY32646.1 malate dehydrogenase [Strigomonas culicis]
MFFTRPSTHFSRRSSSKALSFGTGSVFATPSLPSSTRELKYSHLGFTSLLTKVYTATPCSPLRARMAASANSAAAYAMESVAEPAPSFALTTSSPPNWMRWVSAFTCSAESSGYLDRRGTMVSPLWPPITGTSTSTGAFPIASLTKVLARTRSSVVTPKSLRGSYAPAFFSASAATGTVLLTGLLMTPMIALGEFLPTALARVCTMFALVLKRSSRVMPGLRGTPAGMSTRSTPVTASASCSAPKPTTLEEVEMWERSAATPGAPLTS